MNAKQRTKWSAYRAKGQVRFLLVEGILKLGGMFAILMLVSNYLFDYGFTNSNLADYLSSRKTISDFIYGGLFFGSLMGLFFWYMGEREFKKPEKKDEGQIE